MISSINQQQNQPQDASPIKYRENSTIENPSSIEKYKPALNLVKSIFKRARTTLNNDHIPEDNNVESQSKYHKRFSQYLKGHNIQESGGIEDLRYYDDNSHLLNSNNNNNDNNTSASNNVPPQVNTNIEVPPSRTQQTISHGAGNNRTSNNTSTQEYNSFNRGSSNLTQTHNEGTLSSSLPNNERILPSHNSSYELQQAYINREQVPLVERTSQFRHNSEAPRDEDFSPPQTLRINPSNTTPHPLGSSRVGSVYHSDNSIVSLTNGLNRFVSRKRLREEDHLENTVQEQMSNIRHKPNNYSVPLQNTVPPYSKPTTYSYSSSSQPVPYGYDSRNSSGYRREQQPYNHYNPTIYQNNEQYDSDSEDSDEEDIEESEQYYNNGGMKYIQETKTTQYTQDMMLLITEQQKRMSQLEKELKLAKELIQKLQEYNVQLEQEKSKSGKKQSRYWTQYEHKKFLEGIEKFGRKDVKKISEFVGTRNSTQVRTHAQKYFAKIEREQKRINELKNQREKETGTEQNVQTINTNAHFIGIGEYDDEEDDME